MINEQGCVLNAYDTALFLILFYLKLLSVLPFYFGGFFHFLVFKPFRIFFCT